ncbi:MAG: sulfotransferase [Syntrophobacteraceae bacterium]
MKAAIRHFFSKRPALLESLRYLLTRLGDHKPGNKPDILLLSCRRSGSTWLMEMIAGEPGFKFVNEPFKPQFIEKVGLPTGLESSLPADCRKILDVPRGYEEHFKSLLLDDNVTRILGPYDVFSRRFHWKTNRRVIKEVHALALADWIEQQDLVFKIVYLLRHPIPTALSMTRGCILRAEASLRHQNFRERYLTMSQVELGWMVLHDGSELEKRILEWCLDNIVPWKIVTTRPHEWLVMTYEELLLSPDQSLRLIADNLGLVHFDRLRQVMTRPSASTHNSHVKLVRSSDPVSLVQKWRPSVSVEMEKQAYAIIQEFGINAYEYGAYVARDEFLHFLETPRLKNSHWEAAPEDRLATS